MRSSPERSGHALAVGLALGLAIVLGMHAGCGTDTDPACDGSFLRYDNFGAPFITSWCRPCHSRELPAGMRQHAPANVNFDSLHEIRTWSKRIASTAGTGSAMPPAGGPSTDERAMLVEWLGCGAR